MINEESLFSNRIESLQLEKKMSIFCFIQFSAYFSLAGAGAISTAASRTMLFFPIPLLVAGLLGLFAIFFARRYYQIQTAIKDHANSFESAPPHAYMGLQVGLAVVCVVWLVILSLIAGFLSSLSNNCSETDPQSNCPRISLLYTTLGVVPSVLASICCLGSCLVIVGFQYLRKSSSFSSSHDENHPYSHL